MKKVLSLIVVLAVTSMCMAMVGWLNRPIHCDESGSVQTSSICKVNEKPKCSNVVNGKVCGGTLELSFTAYKETTDKDCPFCNGTGKNCKYDHCNKGKIWEWRSAYVCKTCGALYDVEEIQKQM